MGKDESEEDGMLDGKIATASDKRTRACFAGMPTGFLVQFSKRRCRALLRFARMSSVSLTLMARSRMRPLLRR